MVHANPLAAPAPAEEVSGRSMNTARNANTPLNETARIPGDWPGCSGKPAYGQRVTVYPRFGG